MTADRRELSDFRHQLLTDDPPDATAESVGMEFNQGAPDDDRFIAQIELAEELDAATSQEDIRAIAERFRMGEAHRLHTKIKRFEARLTRIIDEMGRAYTEERSRAPINFNTRYPIAERRGKARLEIFQLADGSIDRTSGDGERTIGLTLGLPMQAINTAHAVWEEYLFESGPMPNDITARGRNDENDDKEEMFRAAVEDQHTRADYRSHLSDAIYTMCRHGTCTLRQRWTERSSVEIADDGSMQEIIQHEGMKLENWPLPDVYVSDPDKSSAADQRTVIWVSRVTLSELEEEEAVFEVRNDLVASEEGEEDAPTVVIEHGRFINLERIRRRHDRMEVRLRNDFQDRGHLFDWIDDANRRIDLDRPTPTELTRLIEIEGKVPLVKMVLDGELDLEILEYFGVPTDGMEQMSAIELGRICSRVCWNIALNEIGECYQFEPAPYKPARTTLKSAQYVPIEGFYGMGIVDLGFEIDDIIDGLVNDAIEISKHRANPNYLIDMSMLLDPRGDQISPSEAKKLVRGWNELILTRNLNAKDGIHAIFPEADPAWTQNVDGLIEHHNERTLINEQLKGQSSSKTATEAKQNLNRSTSRGIDRSRAFGISLVEPIDRDLARDFEAFMDSGGALTAGTLENPGSFENYIMRVAGRVGMKAHYIFPRLTGLADEFKFVHSGDPSNNVEIQIAQLQDTAAFFIPLGTMDPIVVQDELLSLQREKNPGRFHLAGNMNTDPRLELRLMANNHYISPTMQEDAMTHYAVHLQQLVALDEEAFLELNPQVALFISQELNPSPVSVPPGLERFVYDPQIVIPALLQHMKETERIVQAVMLQLFNEQITAEQENQENGDDVVDAEFSQAGPAGLPAPQNNRSEQSPESIENGIVAGASTASLPFSGLNGGPN
jgi:hypothetical protein